MDVIISVPELMPPSLPRFPSSCPYIKAAPAHAFYRSLSITYLRELFPIPLRVKSVVLKVSIWTRGVGITWDLAGDANYVAPPQAY